jgi:hypothetical protein
MNSGDIAGFLITTVITLSVTVLLVVRMRTRARNQVGSPELREILARLERVEQAIDAVAVEAERISEGQRFTTKLLAERAPAANEPR